jgi:hypothetical protein
MINNVTLNAIVEFLQGTCMHTLNDAVEAVTDGKHTEADLTEANHDYISNEIFECTECGWWCETSEMGESDDENICSDCLDQ